MKIDLHIHTKSMYKGDGIKRNVDKKLFNQSLRDAGVGLAAITNHNYFDDEQFKKFEDKESYLLLPGIEVDFFENQDKKKRSQLNIIFSNEEINFAKSISDFLVNKKISQKNPIPIYDLISKLKGRNVILFIDQKNGKTKITKEGVKYIENNLKDIPVIHDANNIRTLRILMASNINALIGSDIQDWSKYNECSNKLVESQWPIKKFESFREVLKTGKPMNEWLSKLTGENFSLKIEDDNFCIKILKSGINVIIGDKGTGKTEILKNIRENIGENDSAYFSEDEKIEKFNKLIKKPDNIFDENIEVESELKRRFKYMSKMRINENNSPKDFYFHLQSPNLSEWKIQDSKMDNNEKVDFNKLISLTKKLVNLKEFLKDNESELFLKDNKDEYIKIHNELDFFLKLTQKNFISKNMRLISSYLSDQVKNDVRVIMSQEKGLKSADLSTGLLNFYKFNKEFKKNSEEIKKITLLRNKKIILNDNIPTIGMIKIMEKNEIIPFSNPKNIVKKNSLDHKTKELKKSLQYFQKTSFDNITEFQNYWSEENINKGFIFGERIIIDGENKKKIRLSSGQKSILLLSRTLNSNKQYILLDEPSARVGSNSIMKYVNEKMEKLRRSGKTLILTTHNSTLAINSLPNKFFLRNKSGEKYETLWSHIYSDYFYDSNNNEKVKFNEIVLDLLEGGEKSYETRKGIYESKVIYKRR